MRFFVVVALAAAASTATPAAADEGRSHDYAVGARAMGLGGAYGALADDATGVFYNPAGLADVARPRLSIGTSLYGLELEGGTPVESAVLRLQRGVTATDLIIVPSTTGFVLGLGERLPSGAYRHAIGIATTVPQYTSRFVETVATDDAGTRFRSALVDRTLHAGVGWGARASPWLRIGVALHYVLRTIDAEESLLSRGDGLLLAETRLRAASSSARAAFGVKVRAGPRLHLGATATTPSVGAWRSLLFESTTVASEATTGEAVVDAARVEDDGFTLQSQVPGSLRLGIAWTEPGDVVIAADVVGHLPSSYEVVPVARLAQAGVVVDRVPIPLVVSRGPLANVALGVEKLVTDRFSVAIGGFTNLTAAPALAVDGAGFLRPGTSRLSNVHMIGGSLALGFWGAHNVARLGVTGSTGYGRIVVPSTPDERFGSGAPPLRAIEAVQTYVYVFWSSTFRFGEAGAPTDYSL